MEYHGIGYSNIRLPDNKSNYAYKYNNRFNTLERNSASYGFEVPNLHDYIKYGYIEEKLEGQKKWYIDYMNKNINYNGKKIGLPSEIYTHKPVHESNFKYSIETDDLKEPQNIIEVIRREIHQE